MGSGHTHTHTHTHAHTRSQTYIMQTQSNRIVRHVEFWSISGTEVSGWGAAGWGEGRKAHSGAQGLRAGGWEWEAGYHPHTALRTHALMM